MALAIATVLLTQTIVSVLVARTYAQSNHSPQRYEWWWTPFWLTPEIILVVGFAARRPRQERRSIADSTERRSIADSTDALIVGAAFVAAVTALPLLAAITDYAVMNGAPP